MASLKSLVPWFVIGATVVTLTGCGSQNAVGGGLPSPQPLPSSTTHSTTPSTGTTSPQGGTPSTGSTSPSSTTTPGSTSGTVTSGTTATGQPSGSTVTGASGSSVTGTSVTGSVTGSTTSGTTLTTMQVGTGSSNPFVPVSSQISDIYVPANWVLHTDSLGDGGNIYRLINPAQPAENLVEVVQSSARDLAGFMGQISQGGHAYYVIPQQAIEYTIPNPNLPYEDRGIVANLSNGGSIRLDVYLPSSEKAVAQKIIESFIKPLS
ncbi:hypothetical protein [Ferroacidibacillus organovorans]|nr:hypothetical protein [Ferroacidibacillus organovorans]